ncbi:MAG: FtsX-like permease family protein [bacterium]
MFPLKLVVKNAFRRKVRTFLTILSIAIALLAFGLLQTLVNSWYAGANSASSYRLVTRNAISLAFSLPISYKDKISQIDGVQEVTYGDWFGGIYIEEKNFFPNFAVEPRGYLKLYDYLIPPEQSASFLRDRRAALAGCKLRDRFGWKVGDSITLKGTIFPGTWEFMLAGFYQAGVNDIDETQFFFHWDYLNETIRETMPHRADQVDFYLIGVKSPDLATKVSLAVDKTFKNSLAETLTETEKSFQLSFLAMSDAIIKAVQLVSLVVIFIIMAVAANTMIMSVRERTAEYAVFKTLGFGPWPIMVLILGESLIIAMTGCALGIALTIPVKNAIARALSDYLPIFILNTKIFLYYAIASVLVGITAAIIPAWRAAKVPIAEELGRIP